MDAWENDRRRSGGAGWILDESGEWVATSAEPELPPEVAATPVAVPPKAKLRGRAGRAFRVLMTVIVIPAIAASAVLYVWKGPGGEIVLSRIEPLVASYLEARVPDPDPAPGADAAAEADPEASARARPATARAPTFQSDPLPELSDCTSVRRGMADGIVFHRAGDCPD